MNWIPIKEEDPPLQKKVVVMLKNGQPYVGSFDGDAWKVHGVFQLAPDHKDFPITHWCDCIPERGSSPQSFVTGQ